MNIFKRKHNHLLKAVLNLAIFFGFSQWSYGQNFDWAQGLGASFNDVGTALALDTSGNLYYAGSFTGTVDFDTGEDSFFLSSDGGNDAFLTKMDASGNFMWAIKIGGFGEDFSKSIQVDKEGNVFITGLFQKTVDFDPSANTSNLVSAGSSDVFIAKYNSNGLFIWAKRMGGLLYDESTDIAYDGSSLVITGSFSGTADFDPGPNTTNFTVFGSADIYIAKLDTAGNFVWAKQIGGSSNDVGMSLGIDAAGNIYCTGYFLTKADFDPGANTYYLTPVGIDDAFVCKLDPNGTFIWAKQLGGTGDEFAKSIKLDAAGNIYTTGSFSQSGDFDPGSATFTLTSSGSADIYVSKLDSSGNFLWAKSMGSSQSDASTSLFLDASAHVFVTGRFGGTADFDPSNSTFNLVSAGNSDVFVLHLDPMGNLVWAKSMGGSEADQGSALVVDATGNIYTTGFFNLTADFDPSNQTYNLTSAGYNDAFLVKLINDPTSLKTFKKNKILLYPNPLAHDVLKISTEQAGSFDLLDYTGKTLLSGELVQGENRISIDNVISTGIYFIRVNAVTYKLIINR